MTAHPTAFVGLLPIDGACSCPACGVTGLDREDMDGPNAFRPLHFNSLIERYGATVCVRCSEQHVTCDDCGRAFKKDDVEMRDAGWFCADCAERSGDDVAFEAAVYRGSV